MAYPTTKFAGITVPYTPLIESALKYAKEISPPWLFHHIMRGWLFATKLVDAEKPRGIDTETLALAILLHDLGLVPQHNTPQRRFEVDGAIAAVEFLQKHSSTPVDAADLNLRLRDLLVWDAIALHTGTSITPDHIAPEVVFAQRGIDMEYGGFGIETLPDMEETVKAVLAAFPRLDFKNGFKESMCSLARDKPETTYDNFVAAFGQTYVEGYEVNRDVKKKIDGLQHNVFDKWL